MSADTFRALDRAIALSNPCVAGLLSSRVRDAATARGPSADAAPSPSASRSVSPTASGGPQPPGPAYPAGSGDTLPLDLRPDRGRDRRRALTEHEIAALRLMLVGPFERVAVLGGWSWRQNGRTISRRTAMQLVRRRLAMVVGDCLAATGKAALLLRRHRSAAPTLYGYNRAPIGGQIARQA